MSCTLPFSQVVYECKATDDKTKEQKQKEINEEFSKRVKNAPSTCSSKIDILESLASSYKDDPVSLEIINSKKNKAISDFVSSKTMYSTKFKNIKSLKGTLGETNLLVKNAINDKIKELSKLIKQSDFEDHFKVKLKRALNNPMRIVKSLSGNEKIMTLYFFYKTIVENPEIKEYLKKEINDTIKSTSLKDFPYYLSFWLENKMHHNINFCTLFDCGHDMNWCKYIELRKCVFVPETNDTVFANLKKQLEENIQRTKNIFRLNEFRINFLLDFEKEFSLDDSFKKILEDKRSKYQDMNNFILDPENYQPVAYAKNRKTVEDVKKILNSLEEPNDQAIKTREEIIEKYLCSDCSEKEAFLFCFMASMYDELCNTDKKCNIYGTPAYEKYNEQMEIFLPRFFQILSIGSGPQHPDDFDLVFYYLCRVKKINCDEKIVSSAINVIKNIQATWEDDDRLEKKTSLEDIQNEFTNILLASDKKCHRFINLGWLNQYIEAESKKIQDFLGANKNIPKYVVLKRVNDLVSTGILKVMTDKKIQDLKISTKDFKGFVEEYLVSEGATNKISQITLLSKLLLKTKDEILLSKSKGIDEVSREILNKINSITFKPSDITWHINSDSSKDVLQKKVKIKELIQDFPDNVSLRKSFIKICEDFENTQKQKRILVEDYKIDETLLKKMSVYFTEFLNLEKENKLEAYQASNLYLNLLNYLSLNFKDNEILKEEIKNFSFKDIFKRENSSFLKAIKILTFGSVLNIKNDTFLGEAIESFLRDTIEVNEETKRKITDISSEIFLKTKDKISLDIFLKFQEKDEEKFKLFAHSLKTNTENLLDGAKRILDLDISNIPSILKRFEQDYAARETFIKNVVLKVISQEHFDNITIDDYKKVLEELTADEINSEILKPLEGVKHNQDLNMIFEIYFQKKGLSVQSYELLCEHTSKKQKINSIVKKMLSENTTDIKSSIDILLQTKIISANNKDDVKYIYKNFVFKSEGFLNSEENIKYLQEKFGFLVCSCFEDDSLKFLEDSLENKDENKRYYSFVEFLGYFKEKINHKVSDEQTQKEFDFINNNLTFILDFKSKEKNKNARNIVSLDALRGIYGSKINTKNREKMLLDFKINQNPKNFKEYKEDRYGFFKNFAYSFKKDASQKTKNIFINHTGNHLTLGNHAFTSSHIIGICKIFGLNILNIEDRLIIYQIFTTGAENMTSDYSPEHNSYNFCIPFEATDGKTYTLKACFDATSGVLRTFYLLSVNTAAV